MVWQSNNNIYQAPVAKRGEAPHEGAGLWEVPHEGAGLLDVPLKKKVDLGEVPHKGTGRGPWPADGPEAGHLGGGEGLHGDLSGSQPLQLQSCGPITLNTTL